MPADRDSLSDRGGCDAAGCEVCALATELAEERALTGRLQAENERQASKIRRAYRALSNTGIDHTVRHNQRWMSVALEILRAELSASSDEQYVADVATPFEGSEVCLVTGDHDACMLPGCECPCHSRPFRETNAPKET